MPSPGAGSSRLKAKLQLMDILVSSMRSHDAYSIHKGMTVCDAHCDTVERILKHRIDLGIRSNKGHIDIPRMIEGGVDVQVFACCVHGPGKPAGYYVKLARKMIDTLRSQFSRHSNSIELALKVSDIYKSNKNGKIAAIIGVESGQAIEDDLNNLQNFYNLGMRIMTLTWKSTKWADASQEAMKRNGLTDFGKSVIKEMNRLKIVIDVSHAADKTVWDTLKISRDPIIASHSCAKAICDHPRNLGDDLIKAIAKAGGVICVNFYSLFLDQKYKLLSAKGLKPKPPPMSGVIDHIEHIVEVGGIDSVGIGSDFDGMNPPPVGLENVSKMPGITEELLKRGYLMEEIVKIMGGNFLRVFGQVCGV